MKLYHCPPCIFETFKRARATTKAWKHQLLHFYWICFNYHQICPYFRSLRTPVTWRDGTRSRTRTKKSSWSSSGSSPGMIWFHVWGGFHLVRTQIIRLFWPPSPLVRILAKSVRLNSRNLPYYVCILATSPLPLGAYVLNGSPLSQIGHNKNDGKVRSGLRGWF